MGFERVDSSLAWLAGTGASGFAGEWGLALAVALLLVGFGLIVAEIVVPSGGALTILAVAVLIVSVVAAFSHDATAGIVFLIGVLLVAPKVAIVALKVVLPRTAIGKRMVNRGDPASDSQRRAVVHEEKALVGRVGRVVTPLRPGGRAEIAGEWRDVVAGNGAMVEVGTAVEVVEVSGNRVVVRPVQRPRE